jgi:hypothetical protein
MCADASTGPIHSFSVCFRTFGVVRSPLLIRVMLQLLSCGERPHWTEYVIKLRIITPLWRKKGAPLFFFFLLAFLSFCSHPQWHFLQGLETALWTAQSTFWRMYVFKSMELPTRRKRYFWHSVRRWLLWSGLSTGSSVSPDHFDISLLSMWFLCPCQFWGMKTPPCVHVRYLHLPWNKGMACL